MQEKSTTHITLLQLGGLALVFAGLFGLLASVWTLPLLLFGLLVVVATAVWAKRVKRENWQNSQAGRFHNARDAKDAALAEAQDKRIAARRARRKREHQKQQDAEADARVADLDLK